MGSPYNRPHSIEIDKDAKGEFRWNRKAGNSRIISTCGEGYKNKADMWHGLRLANSDHETVKIVDKTELGYEGGESLPS